MIDEEYILLNRFYFDSVSDFCKVNVIANDTDKFEEIKPEWYYENLGFVERWFKHKVTQETYLLIEPDFPYMGLWTKIDPASPPVCEKE